MNKFTDEQLSKMNLEQCSMLSHRFKYPESARYLHGVAQVEANRYERAGNVCMAHAKRLQARYWARRMGIANEAQYKQLELDVPGYSYVHKLMWGNA